jgi:hypothetical protein
MAIQRSGNFLSQQRLDVPWLKSIESGVTFDFDTLVGLSLSNGGPLVLKGLTLNTTGMIGGLPTNLTLNIAGSVMWNYSASESGSIFVIPEDEPVQQLSSTNSNVLGGFVTGVNYVGIDVFKIADPDTTDTVKFIDSDAGVETSQSVPVARTIQYRIVISPQPFSSSKNIVPVAAITVAAGAITKIVDARPMMFRLGSGGEFADAASFFTWGGRTENAITMASNSSPSPFAGEDKSISNLKSWMDSIMTSLWELRGGSAWYSDIYRDHVKLVYGQPVLANGDNVWFLDGVALALSKSGTDLVTVTLVDHPFTLNSTFELSSVDPNFPSGTYTVTNIVDPDTFQYSDGLSTTNTGVGDVVNTVAFAGMSLLFENSKDALLYKNDIFTGSFVLPDKYCAFVDLTRESSATIAPQIRPIYDLSASASPGRRHILCWRDGGYVWCKDKNYEAGRTYLAATTTALGLVKINVTAGTPAAPVVPVIRSVGSQFYGAPSALIGTPGGAGVSGNGGANSALGEAGHGVFGLAGQSTDSANDGVGVWGLGRGLAGVVGRIFGASAYGVGGAFSGQGGISFLSDIRAWVQYTPNAGVLAVGGTDGTGIYAFGGWQSGAALPYTGAFGGYFRGKANHASILAEVNGNAPGQVIINRSGAAIPLPTFPYNQYLYTNVNTALFVESVITTTDPTVWIQKTTTNPNSDLIRLIDASPGVAINIFNVNTNGTGIKIDTPGANAKAIEVVNGDIRLSSSSNKLRYTTSPTYEFFSGISSANWGTNWTRTSANFVEGAVVCSTADAGKTLAFRVVVPKNALILTVEAIVLNDLNTVNLDYCAFTISSSGFARTPSYKNSGGAGGNTVSVGASVNNQRISLPLSSSFTIGNLEDFHVTIGRQAATTNLQIVGVVVAYELPNITGASN